MLNLQSILQSASDKAIAENIVKSYQKAQESYLKNNWGDCSLYGGHFVEATIRFVDYKLIGAYHPFGSTLQKFNEDSLKQYSNKSGSETYRLLIPRVLFALNMFRNKRSNAHIGTINPSEFDAQYILDSIKWILAEIIKEETVDPTEINSRSELINSVSKRTLPILWEYEDILRILPSNYSLEQKILILLLVRNSLLVVDLFKSIEYQNLYRFKGILKKMHTQRRIELNLEKGLCVITPKGRTEAQAIVDEYSKML